MKTSTHSSNPLPASFGERREVSGTCETHGPFTTSVLFGPSPWSREELTQLTPAVCPTCAEERLAAEEAAEARRREVDRQHRIAALVRHAGIPARYSDRTLDSYVAVTPSQRRVREIAVAYAQGFDTSAGRSLIFTGTPGTGKTHLVCAIGSELISREITFRYTTALQAVRTIKATYNSRDKTDAAAIGELVAPDLLALDEIGVGFGSQHEMTLLFEVLNERYANLRSTILVSNLTEAELTAFLGERIIDRFRESGIVLAFDWKSHRSLKAA